MSEEIIWEQEMGVVSAGKLTQCQMGPKKKLIWDNVTAYFCSQLFLTLSQSREEVFYDPATMPRGGRILVEVNICIYGWQSVKLLIS